MCEKINENKFFDTIRRYKRYFMNELQHKLQKGGDKRCAFLKRIHKCRYLELPAMINNPGLCDCPEHQ
jgi:hypothetical protein